MSDFFDFTERYLSTDGKEYIDANSVREVLGVVDEHVDILGVIKKLREERDQLKEKCDKMKKRANAVYGVSCGYSGDKAPAFRCNVISYSWELAPIEVCSLMDKPSYPIRNNSIRVELDLTPTANYKGAFDLEDLKHYIQAYGREKKLGIGEASDTFDDPRYKFLSILSSELGFRSIVGPGNVEKTEQDILRVVKSRNERAKKDADDRREFLRKLGCELGVLYPIVKPGTEEKVEADILERIGELKEGNWPCENGVTFAAYMRKQFPKECEKWNVAPLQEGSVHDWVQYIFGVLDEWRNLANNNFNKAEGFRKEKLAVEDSLAGLRAKVREIYRSVVDDEWDAYRGHASISALNDINAEYKRVVHNFEERTADWSKVQQELDRYRLAVGSLCNIPAEHRDDISWIEDAFNDTKKDYLKWQTQADRLARLRSDICTALCLGGETRDEDILNAITKMRKKCNDLIVFRNDVAKAIGLAYIDINSDIINRVMDTKYCHDKLCEEYTELRKAIWEAMDRKPETLPEENARLVGEVRMLQLNNISLKWMHDEVAKAIGMDYPVTNNDIVNRVKSLYDANGSSCDVISDLKRQVVELARGKKLLIEFRDDVAKAIGMGYPTTNQVILNNVQYIYKDREDAYKIVSKLNDQVTALSKAKEDLQQMLIDSQKDAKGWTNRCICLADTHSEMQAFRRNTIDDLKTRGFCFRYEEDETLPEIFDKLLKSYDLVYGEYKEQYRLRQMWHVRWESENERANGEHKRAEKLRKDVTALTNHIELLKISNASQANSIVASQAFKNECRKLKEEKAKVIAALGQDIWDDCLK